LVGAALNGQMFGVNFFADRLPAWPRLIARLLVRAIVIAIALAVINAAWAQIETARFTRFLALGWPKWIVSAGLLVSMVLLIIVQVREAVDLVRSRTSEDRP
jgi:TRAP-type C4-dicarboxylate transport system permease small subunit